METSNLDFYRMAEPVVVSVSGGRTSMFMVAKILQAYGGEWPDHYLLCFANTGKEMPQTLDFVATAQNYWGLDIHWLELGDYEQVGIWQSGPHEGKPRFKATTVEVSYETASRNGEPFERLIDKRQYLPNLMQRFCTQDLKLNRIKYFAREHFGEDPTHFVGIRADEPRRAARIHAQRTEGHDVWCPLFLDGIAKEHVFNYWAYFASFDLHLPNQNGVTDLGNCDLCFLKGHKKKQSIINIRPDLADWWVAQEAKFDSSSTGSAARFRNDQPSYNEMVIASSQQPLLLEDDQSFACFCGD